MSEMGVCRLMEEGETSAGDGEGERGAVACLVGESVARKRARLTSRRMSRRVRLSRGSRRRVIVVE